ncbi:glycine betaine ABC transporter substrate-binding protein [Candidatus Albibeggiatoa sp. nov. BB20]|uniref:glycine betaine ABC transporter substrate-binding protein n=1 Tax=Candidatus Albibeggiatoa sp. nov. BB20 TaxID=3162723 RepID=UPI0033654735
MRLLSLVLFLCCLTPVHAQQEKVELVYVEWSDSIASTHIVSVVLENMGYKVKTISVSAAVMWQSVASGDADGFVSAWLPTAHGHYLTAVGHEIEDLGANVTGTKIGLAVPDYVEIESLTELKANADKFDGKIIGIDPGAGIMSKTEEMIKSYQLRRKFDLIEGSDATMVAVLADAIDNQAWVAVTAWTPHWKFNRWSLKYLQDPKQIYGGEESIHTVVRKGLKQDMPEVYKVLDNFKLDLNDIQTLMSQNQQQHADPHANAQRWIEENPDKVNSWK